MTPVNLGDLPSNQPAPTGVCQYKRGASNAQTACPGDSQIMYDGAGGPMQIAITTGSRPGWWIVRAEGIFLIPDGAWYYGAYFIRLTPADADGISTHYGHHRLHSALGWQQCCIDGVHRLNPSTTYTLQILFGYRQGGSWYYWTGPDYLTLGGEFVAEGSL